MKRLIMIFFLASNIVSAQNRSSGFGVLSTQLFANHEFGDRFGVNVCAGIGKNKVTVGPSVDLFLFGKSTRFVIPKVDLRYFFTKSNAKARPFISGQIGWILLNEDAGANWISGAKTTGSAALDILVGGIINPQKKGPGISLALGASFLDFETNESNYPYWGAKVQLGIKL